MHGSPIKLQNFHLYIYRLFHLLRKAEFCFPILKYKINVNGSSASSITSLHCTARVVVTWSVMFENIEFKGILEPV